MPQQSFDRGRKEEVSHSWGEEKNLGPFHPSWMLIGFFTVLIGAGTVLLMLPFSTAGGNPPSLIEAFFTSASAATGTGLAVNDIATFWSFFGLRVIAALIFIGGVGSIAGSTMLLLLIARQISTEERPLLKEFSGVQSARGMAALTVGVFLYALAVQAAGAYVLASNLSTAMSPDEAWWHGIFQSISAFNNAGFEIMGLSQHLPAPSVQLVLLALSLLGSLSFIMFIDLTRGIFKRTLSTDTKMVLSATTVLLVIGMLVILVTEYGNRETLGPLPLGQKLLSAFFHSVSARTTGLSTLNIGAFSSVALLVITALMFIGGSSGSSSGGIKTNTFALLVAVTWCFIRGKRHVEVFGGRVHEEQVYRALAVVFLSVLLVFGVTVGLTITDGPKLLPELFEAVSAFSTTGFSMGLTTELSDNGKLLITFMMFAGRVGPVTLAFALSTRRQPTQHTYAEEAINLG